MKKKMIFIRLLKSSFIEKDLELLSNHFDIKVVNFNFNAKNSNGTLLTKLKLIKGVLWADITFSWFADFHAYQAVKLSKFFGKKSIVVIGGYEVANIPELKYGSLLFPERAQIVKYILDNSSIVLTVDESLKNDALKNLRGNWSNIKTIPTGYDHKIFKPNEGKEKFVLTVSIGDSWNRVRLKGLDTFVKSARFLPDLKFVLIGIQGDALKKLKDVAPTNVEFVDPLTQNELIQYYQKTKVYCQLSMREGLPNALCEAMLCECVPVGTDVQGIRSAIGDTGFYVSYGNPEETANAIKEALKSDKGKDARERIKRMFTVEKRKKELVATIDQLFEN